MKTFNAHIVSRPLSTLGLAVALLAGARTFAGPFITGNLVVLQSGDTTAALSSAASPQFVLEYLPGTANQGGPVQTIAIPTNGPSRLLITGNATSEGHIAISLN